MKPAACYNLVAAILVFVAAGVALLANYPEIGVGKLNYEGEYNDKIQYGFWETCLMNEWGNVDDKEKAKGCVKAKEYPDAYEEATSNYDDDQVKWGKLFRDMGYAAITMINVGALAAVVLGILLLLTVCGCLIHSKGAGCILNIIGASSMVLLLTTGCVLMTIDYQFFVTRGKGDAKFADPPKYTLQAMLKIVRGSADFGPYWAYVTPSVGWAFFMPWSALLLAIIAMILVIVAILCYPFKPKHKKRVKRRDKKAREAEKEAEKNKGKK